MANHQNKNKTNWIVVMLGILITAIPLTIILGSSLRQEETVVEESEKELVGVQTPSYQDIEKTTSVIGSVDNTDQRVIIPEISGKVNEVYVEEGDSVTKGELLFTFDDIDYQLQLEEAKAAKRGAEAQLREAKAGARSGERTEAETAVESARRGKDQAKKEHERIKTLHQEGFVSDQELEQVEMQYHNAKDQLKSAEAYLEMVEEGARPEQIEALEVQVEQASLGVQLAERNLDRAQVTAPADGEIAVLEVKEGQLAGTAEPAAIITADTKQIRTLVSETYINKISEGDQALIEIPSIQEEPFTGLITNIGSMPPENGSSYPVEILLDEFDETNQLRSGMFSRIILTIDKSSNALVLPRQALIRSEEGFIVYIVNEDDEIEVQEVEIGINQGGYTEIVDGLTESDVVVIEGQDNVVPGDRVETQDFVQVGDDR